MYKLTEIMTTELSTLSPQDSLEDARQLMRGKRIRHIPIVEEGALVGLVTKRDLLAAMDSNLYEVSDEQPPGQNERSIRVSSFMTRDIKTVDQFADMATAGRYLETHKLGCLPVVRDDKLIGIVTESDFVGLAVNLLEQLEDREPSIAD